MEKKKAEIFFFKKGGKPGCNFRKNTIRANTLKKPGAVLIGGMILLICIVFLSGCATGKGKRKPPEKLVVASRSKVPSWVTKIPEEKNYLYFIGTSGDVPTFDQGKKEAVNDALSQVVSAIGVKVTATSTYEEKYFAEQYTTEISSELLSEGKARVQDAEIKEVYYEQYERKDGSKFFRVWVLLKYSREDIKTEQRRLQEILQMRYGEVKRLEEKALELQNKGLFFDAFTTSLNACVASLKLEDEGVFFDRNIIRAQQILTGFQLKKFGEDQIGYVGKPLQKPLGVKVIFSKEGKEMGVPNVPVEFRYRVPRSKTLGYKYLVYNKITDASGMAELVVDMVYEVSDRNMVEVSLDIERYIKQLEDVPPELQGRVDSLKEILQIKRTSFVFKSDTLARDIRTGVYFFQIDQDGTLLTKPVTAPEVYQVLYDKRFSIRVFDLPPSSLYGQSEEEIIQRLEKNAGKGLKRILLGYINILDYDTISGFFTARAEAQAKLYDRESGEIIRTWSIQRSGTGSTKELARTSVLTEAGRSLGVIISNTIP